MLPGRLHRSLILGAIVALLAAADGTAQTAEDKRQHSAIEMQAFARDWAFQSLKTGAQATKRDGQREAFNGREDLAIDVVEEGMPKCAPLKANPIDVILARAQQTNIVIVNESHAAPAHRQFVGQILQALRTEGFSYYAAETFIQNDDLFHDDGDALGGDGWYSNEPIFGRTVRLARRLGFQLVGYEETPEQQKASEQAGLDRIDGREEAQVQNLMEKIFRNDPKAKVVIHVGHDHVKELPIPRQNGGERRMMAARLKQASGNDPLTISQTTCLSPTSAIVASAQSDDAGTGMAPASVDLYIGHPPLTFEDKRPAWRRLAGDIAVPLPKEAEEFDEPVMIEARRANQSLASVPTDRLMIFPGEKLPLLLPSGSYRLDVFGASGSLGQLPAVAAGGR